MNKKCIHMAADWDSKELRVDLEWMLYPKILWKALLFLKSTTLAKGWFIGEDSIENIEYLFKVNVFFLQISPQIFW